MFKNNRNFPFLGDSCFGVRAIYRYNMVSPALFCFCSQCSIAQNSQTVCRGFVERAVVSGSAILVVALPVVFRC